MNSCRMTFKILVALLFALTLCVPTMAEKIGDPSGPTTLQQAQGIIDQEAAVKAAPDQPGEEQHPGEEPHPLEITDFPEDSRFAPFHPGTPVLDGQRSGILTEGFETTMPPAGWSLITLNAITWDLATYNPHGGLQYASCAYDSFYTGPQDEWLVSPALDLSGATTDLSISFWWNMSYYWGVSPYDNYDLELWISIDGGATWPTKLWDESGEGTFTSWEWYNENIDLSAYAGQANVKLAFRYAGYDGAQACVDDVYLNDDPPPTGRCCYNLGANCDDISQAACLALGGAWDITKTCATDPCPTGPTGIDCSAPIPIDIDPAAFPIVVPGTTVDALNDYANTCLGYYDSGADRIYKITVAGTGRVPLRITMNPGTTTYTGFGIATACPLPETNCYLVKTNSAATVYYIDTAFTGGETYYMQVDTWSTPFDIAAYTLTFGNPPIGRCCTNEGLTCDDISEAACMALGGSWDGTKTCAANPCPTGATGIDCGSPIAINIDPLALPLVIDSQTTVGAVDNYNATCMGNYDNGDDRVYKITVGGTGRIPIRITMNPGTSTYTGFGVATTCPFPSSGCYLVKSSSSAVVYYIDTAFTGGSTYYMMVDTWPSPQNIPYYKLTFSTPPAPPANDNCANAQVISDVTDLPFSTTMATPDGPGGWITSKNIWYKYTATCNGNVTVSLCGSTFDTKVRIYQKNGCPTIADSIAGNDDGCSGYPTGSTLASRVKFYTAPGVTYMIEVGGYGTAAGDGLLTVLCQVAPPRDNCVDAVPVTLTPGVPVTFNGNNAGSTPDCSLLSTYSQTWEAFTITQCMDVTLNYCGTTPAFTNALLNLVIGCPCGALTAAAVYNTTACGDGNVTMTWAGLAAGTYYYPVIEGSGYSGAYTLHVVGNIPTSYCAATATTCDEYISAVTVGTIDNYSGCGLVSNYSNYTALSTDMVQGLSYGITVQNGYPYSSDQCGIWIDWNNDFCFGAGEQVTVSGTPGGGPYTATITAPCDVATGAKRLRIRVMYTGTVSPCGNTSYGEVEDYTINLLPHPIADPLAVVTPNPQYAYYAHALDPIINSFYVGNFAGFLPNQVNLATVQVNGETPTAVSVIPSYTGIYCGALKVQMPLASFIDNYGVLYDTTNTTFVVTGNFNDVGATPFSVTGDVTLIGHASSAPSMFILPPTGVMLPGDFDASGALDISDAVAMVAYIFAGASGPSNILVGDCDCSGAVDISDAVYMISYIFGGGAAPCR